MMDWNQPLLWFAPLVGPGALVIGLAAMAVPAVASKAFGLQTSGSGLDWVRATGSRDIFLGFTVLILCWRGDRFALSLICFCAAFVAAGDFAMTFLRGSRKISMTHLSGLVIAILYGIWLLRGA